jgi:hypothetical protein
LPPTLGETAAPLSPADPQVKLPKTIQPLVGSSADVTPPTVPSVPGVDTAPPVLGTPPELTPPPPSAPVDDVGAPEAVAVQPQAAAGAQQPQIKYIQPVSDKGPPPGKVEEAKETTDLPDPGLLFRRDSEKQVFQRMALEAPKKEAVKITFPDEIVISKEKYVHRPLTGHWPRQITTVAPSYVCHGRLYFEQLNFERYGWELGAFQPAVSLGLFYFDLLTLPYQASSQPLVHYDCSAGKCLPGDPVPLLLYPPHLSVTGVAGEAAAIMGGVLIIP